MTADTLAEGYGLSWQQQAVWRRCQAGRQGHSQLRSEISGRLEPDLLRSCVLRMVERHEILRSEYATVPGARLPLRVVGDGTDAVAWTCVDLRGASDHRALSVQIDRIADQDAGKPFENRGETVRATLCLLAADRGELILTVPALAADSASLLLIHDELRRVYGGADFDDDPLDYAQYVQWQQREFGRHSDDGGDPPPPAGIGFTVPLQRARQGGPIRSYSMPVPPEVFSALEYRSSELAIDVRAIPLTALRVVLAKSADEVGVAVGALADGRVVQDVRDCVGVFARWLPFVERTDGLDISAASEQTHAALVAAERCFDTPDEQTDPAADWDFQFEYLRLPGFAEHAGLTVRSVHSEADPYVLRLTWVVREGGAMLVWRYQADGFDEGYPEQLADQYLTLLAAMALEPIATPIHSLSALSERARRELVLAFNDTAAERTDGCLHELVSRQAEQTPDAVAVMGADTRLTYAELDEHASSVARALRARGIGPGGAVGVRLTHSPELIVALLAILKTGACFLPIEPALPDRRVAMMLSDLGCAALIAEPSGTAEVAEWLGPILQIGTLVEYGRDVENGGPIACAPDDPAYVMYTSGSSGAPKGVLVPHRAIVNYLLWALKTYRSAPGAAATIVHSSIAFDLTLTSVFVPLLAGSAVALDESWRSIGGLAGALAERGGLDLFKATPSHLTVLGQEFGADSAPAIGTLVIGGEALTTDQVRPWLRPGSQTTVVNEYGPTEAAVGCCVFQTRAGQPLRDGPVPIGRPIANTEILLLDRGLEPVPVGAVGEIYIGGVALAHGYAGATALTADRFIPHPYSAVPGARLYRTGDLACHGPDGELRYLGRRGGYVKVRGMRVEPAEVSAAIRECPGVKDAVVVLNKAIREAASLVAYVVADESGDARTALAPFLSATLPEYMIPGNLVWLDEIPLTANGKVAVDRLVLTTAEPAQVEEPPVGATEIAVGTIFADLLGVAAVDRLAGFFELGGHSLLAMRLIARLNETFGTALRITDIAGEGSGHGGFGGAVSVADMARLVDHGRSATGHRLLVPMRVAPGRPALYCVPAAGGAVLGLRELAEAFGDRVSVYGLQAPPVAVLDPELGVGAIAEHYAAAVLAERPHGPYYLLGWSAGGLIAFEMARQLAHAGHAVEALVLVDSYLYGTGQPTEADPFAAVELFAEELQALAAVPLVVDRASWAGMSAVEAARSVLAQAADLGYLPPETEQADLLDLFDLYRGQTAAAAAFRPKRYPGRVLLVQAADADHPAEATAAVEDWQAVCVRELAVARLPGDHFSLLRNPGVGALADVVHEWTAE